MAWGGKWGRALVGCLSVALLVGCFGCESDGGGGHEPVYVPPMKERVMTVREWHDGVPGGSRKMEFVGTREVAGQTFDTLQVGNFDRAEPDGEKWFVTFGDDEVVFAGGEVFYPSSTLPEGVPDITASVVEPVVIPLDIPPNEPQTIRVQGVVSMGDPAGSPLTYDIDEEVTVTLVGQGEIVETFMGDMASADHYAATATLLDMPASADVWWVEGVGAVRAEYAWAGAPGEHGLSVQAMISAIATEAGYNNVVREALLDAENPSFTVSSTDVNGTLDADKNTHAQMILELRWADDATAHTATEPPVALDFGTAWGWFPASLMQTSYSLFHPEEEGEGYTYWLAVVDQAAKNEPVNGIAYHAGATWNGGTGAVRASGLVLYKPFTGE